MHLFLSHVLSPICEAVLCLELIFAELWQTHYISNLLLLFVASTGRGEILRHNTTMVWLQVLLTEAMCNRSCELYILCMSSTSIVQYKQYCMQLVKVCLNYQTCNCMPSDNRFQVKSQTLCHSFWQVLCTLVHVWLHACICVHMHCVCDSLLVCVFFPILFLTTGNTNIPGLGAKL